MRFAGLLFLFQVLCFISIATASEPNDDFYLLCSGGQDKEIAKLLAENPEWVHAKTKDSEHCLHLAGIQGFPKVTKLFLEKGADPNVRSNPDVGLRMTPLSWNVYGNHVENCKLLLEYGADVNADFDQAHKGKKEKITVLDLFQLISQGAKEEFVALQELLTKYGAKTYKELASGK